MEFAVLWQNICFISLLQPIQQPSQTFHGTPVCQIAAPKALRELPSATGVFISRYPFKKLALVLISSV